jgi:archaellum biogenesis protein FlaJ (TadC family)
MKLETLYRSVISSLCFVGGAAAVLAILYGVLSLLFWSAPVFATIFGLIWAGQSYLHYRWEDPEWQDRARILVRIEDEEDDDDE